MVSIEEMLKELIEDTLYQVEEYGTVYIDNFNITEFLDVVFTQIINNSKVFFSNDDDATDIINNNYDLVAAFIDYWGLIIGDNRILIENQRKNPSLFLFSLLYEGLNDYFVDEETNTYSKFKEKLDKLDSSRLFDDFRR